ncbi:MAG TPA: hypothetical protein VK679_19205 [Gemmatimonadaceae bacterium]|nr:hypothetical protein [Gemmatimonadaceae bacterium]
MTCDAATPNDCGMQNEIRIVSPEHAIFEVTMIGLGIFGLWLLIRRRRAAIA